MKKYYFYKVKVSNKHTGRKQTLKLTGTSKRSITQQLKSLQFIETVHSIDRVEPKLLR